MYCSVYVRLSIMYMQKFAGPKKTRYISLHNQLSIKQKQCSYVYSNKHACVWKISIRKSTRHWRKITDD